MPATLPLRHFLLALAVVAVWGTNFVVIKLALGHLPPLLFAALRFTLALFPAVFLLPKPSVGWRNLALYGVLIGVGQFGLLYLAINGHISPGIASLVVQTQVFFTIGLSMRMSGERVQTFQWLALLLATAGIATIGLHTDGSTTFLGLALVLGAALSWAGGNIAAKEGKPGNMLAYVVWSSAYAVPPLFVLSYVFEGGDAIAGGLDGMGGSRLAVLGQHPVWLRRLGLVAGAPSGRHHHAHGALGAGVWHVRFGLVAGRVTASLETDRSSPGDGRAGREPAVADAAAKVYKPVEPSPAQASKRAL